MAFLVDWIASESRDNRTPPAIFHERQAAFRMHCAIHTLNNLFSEAWLDEDMMESLSLGLNDVGSGRLRSSLGAWLGDWDLQVILAALDLRGAQVLSHIAPSMKLLHGTCEEVVREDERLEAALTDAMDASRERPLLGVIVNRPSRNRLRSAVGGRHWYPIVPRQCPDSGDTAWFNMDSKLSAPQRISRTDDASELPRAHLRELLGQNCQLFFVAVVEAHPCAPEKSEGARV
mmetsp:Transcript_21850/g.61044  ORF Transcript_21850/g.61044 Transcript_21850/m.61044 type:complete len:232 (-) Transcript_21850:105-800(-)